ncbi:MAG TPA: hypothetical protein PK950_00285 [Candidatus Paceibacterota bacterium]|nr:hypothetical protein [Candidatus Paceibacterota bacterium]
MKKTYYLPVILLLMVAGVAVTLFSAENVELEYDSHQYRIRKFGANLTIMGYYAEEDDGYKIVYTGSTVDTIPKRKEIVPLLPEGGSKMIDGITKEDTAIFRNVFALAFPPEK